MRLIKFKPDSIYLGRAYVRCSQTCVLIADHVRSGRGEGRVGLGCHHHGRLSKASRSRGDDGLINGLGGRCLPHRGGDISGRTVLTDIETSVLHARIDTHSDHGIDAKERDPCRGTGPANDRKATDSLDTKLFAARACVVHIRVGSVLNIRVSAEDASRQETPVPCEAVHDSSVARIVDL